jgi:hypothetical protein
MKTETCFICHKEKGQPPDRCNGHYSNSRLIAGLACDWSKETPSESGYWWWWNEDVPPIPVNIEWDPAEGGRYFATQGQHGWNRHQYVEDMGGQWMPLIEPETPAS